jgi:hypothetical protein
MTADLEGRRLGRYRLIDRLGAGRQGTVYRAHDPVIDRPVAVKVAHAGLGGGRMFAEAQLAAALQHPNIVAVFDAGSDAGLDYIVTELVPHHETATVHVAAAPALGLLRALAVLRQAAEALAHAHARGVLHRDIKPSNVLVDRRGQVRLTDFGVALPAGDTTPGEVGGSPAYLAPETCSGRRASETSDLYALGVLLFELLTGRLPFPTGSLEAYRDAQRAGSLPRLADFRSDVPAPLQRVLERCLAPREELRYRAAGDLIGDLMVVQECATPPAPGGPAPERLQRLAGGTPGLDPEEAALLGGLGEWRRMAGGQRLPASPGAGACLVWVTRGSLNLWQPGGETAREAGIATPRRIEAGTRLLLPSVALPGLMAREETELLLLEDARLERLPGPLQQKLLRAAALAAWMP